MTVLVAIAEVEKVRHDTHFLLGFSEKELELCQGTRRGSHSLAARYAAKRAAEALIGVSWQHFEIVRPYESPPLLYRRLLNEATGMYQGTSVSLADSIKLSLAHDEPLAVAHLVMNTTDT